MMNHTSRRSFLLKGLASAVCVGGLPRLLAAEQPADNSDKRELVTPDTEQAIRRGLAYLAAEQHADGSFGSGRGYVQNVGVTGLCGMALLTSGSFKANVAQAVAFTTSQMQDDGLIVAKASRSHGPMYGHAFATQFLAEAARGNREAGMAVRLKRAVDLIVASQNAEGGWRYQPQSKDADVSVTVCQVIALRKAKAAGVEVPQRTLDRATDYVKQCQNDDGGFRYQLSAASVSVFPRSAAAMAALELAGIDDEPRLKRGRDYLNRFLPTGNAADRQNFYFYGHYFAAIAIRNNGGEDWRRWYGGIRDELLKQQAKDGSWSNTSVRICTEYSTALACLILQSADKAKPADEPARKRPPGGGRSAAGF